MTKKDLPGKVTKPFHRLESGGGTVRDLVE